jgi:hypothetical protein
MVSKVCFQMGHLVRPLLRGRHAAVLAVPSQRPAPRRERLVVGRYNLNAVDPQLETAWFQPVSLSSENLVSSLCFHSLNAPGFNP